MISMHPWRTALLSIGLTGLVLGGCTCNGPNVQSNTVALSFDFPSNGATLTAPNDINPDVTGIQVNVVVQARNVPDGAPLVLTNSVAIDGAGVPIETTGSATAGAVTFADYTLPGGSVTLRVAAGDVAPSDTCDGTNCAEVNITVVENACVFTTPVDGSVLTADAYPDTQDALDPFETDITLKCKGLTSADFVALRIAGGLPQVAQPDADGQVIFTQVPLSEGSNLLSVISQTDAKGNNGAGAAITATITVSTTSHCVANLFPGDAAVLLKTDDRDPGIAGMQATLDISSDCSGASSLALYIKGPNETQFTVIPNNSLNKENRPDQLGVRFHLTGVHLPQSIDPYDVAIAVVVTEPAGSGARTGVTLISHVWVDSTPPTLTTASPSEGACLSAVNDVDTGTPGTQIDAAGRTLGAGDGAEIWLRVVDTAAPVCDTDSDCDAKHNCRNSLCRVVAQVSGNDYVFPKLTLPPGNITVEYIALDLAGNQSQPTTANITVADVAPTLAIAAPLNNATLGISDDSDLATTGLQTTLDLDLTQVPTGSQGTLSITGQAAVAFTPQLGNSTENLSITILDGSRTLTARITDTCGNAITDSVQVTAASDPLAMTVTAYEPSTLTFPVANGGTTVSSTLDLDIVTGSGSAPRIVTVRYFDGETAGACSGLQLGSAVTRNILATAFGRLLTNQPVGGLKQGINCIDVSVTDSINTINSVLVVNKIAAPAPPSFISTSPGTMGDPWVLATHDSDNDNTNGFNQTITVAIGTAATAGNLILRVVGTGVGTGVDVAAKTFLAGATSVTFTDVPLQPGVYNVNAVLYYNAGGAATATSATPLSVDINTAGPRILITSPKTGDTVSNLSVAVDFLSSGAQPTACDLFVDNFTTGNEVATVTITTESSTTLNATWISDGPHSIRVTCTDGTDIGFQEITQVTLDTNPPPTPSFVNEPSATPGQIVFVDNNFVNGWVVMGGDAARQRHPVTLRVDGTAESLHGFRLDLKSTATGDAAVTYTACLWEKIPGPLPHTGCLSKVIDTSSTKTANITFPSVNFGSQATGTIQFNAILYDAAGNPSTTTTVTLAKDTVPPTLVQNTPTSTTTTLTSNDDVNTGTDEVDVVFVYDVTGAITGGNCATTPGDCVALTITPAPNNLPAGPHYVALTGSSVSFPTMTFLDSSIISYVAKADVSDAAGNTATVSYNFDVQSVVPSLTWVLPVGSTSGINTLAGFGGNWTTQGSGFAVDTKVALCSTLLPASITALTGSCGIDELGCPCKWGQDGTLGGPNNGFVIAKGFLSGSLKQSNAGFTNVALSQAEQTLHYEARENDNDPDLYSEFRVYNVDTIPPVVTDFSLTQNLAPNDDTNFIRLGAAEGTPVATSITTNASVTVTGVIAGTKIQAWRAPVNGTVDPAHPSNASIILDCPGAGCPQVDASGQATLSLTVPVGAHRLYIVVTDGSQNTNNLQPLLNVQVDVTAPTVTVGVSSKVWTSADATPDTNGTPAVFTDDFISVPVNVQVADDNLGGAVLTLVAYDNVTDNAGAEIPGSSQAVATLVGTETSVDYALFPLRAGLNHLHATLTDPFGNTASSVVSGKRETYKADFYGPTLILQMWDGSDGGASQQSCGTTEAASCLADTLDPADNGGLIVLDKVGGTGDTYCKFPAPQCNTAGSDLRFYLEGCANSDAAIESCGTGNGITVLVESKLSTGGVFSPVTSGSFAAEADVLQTGSPASLFDQSGSAGYAFGGGLIREVRLTAVDHSGNASASNTLFVTINHAAFAFTSRLLDNALSPFAPAVDLDTADGNGDVFLGAKENVSTTPGQFAMNLRVMLDGSSITDTLTRVELSCVPDCQNATATLSQSTIQGTEPNEYVDFIGVEVPKSTPTALASAVFTLQAFCGTTACGTKTYNKVHADIDPPTYQFERCDLCALGVNYTGAGANCTSCGADNALDTADMVANDTTIWNALSDNEQAGTPTTMTLSAGNLRVRIKGLEDSQSVTLTSSQPTKITGNVINSVTGCKSSTTECSVSFPTMQLNTLASNASRHLLQISFTDKAGNTAVPDALRCQGACDSMDEAISALVDTIRPEGVTTTACIGESTTPTNETSLGDTTEALDCGTGGADWCGTSGCSRTGGKVTLHFLEPHDDGTADTGTDLITSYEIWVAALEIPYPNAAGTSFTTFTTCAELIPNLNGSSPTVEKIVVPSLTPAGPNQEQIVPITGLFPNRTYCFGVIGIDDAGNRADITANGNKQVRRAMPLLTTLANMPPPAGPDLLAFDPANPNADGNAASFSGPVVNRSIGYRVTNVGDMDGDGRDDFTVSERDDPPNVWQVALYLSCRNGTRPGCVDAEPLNPIIITGPGTGSGVFDDFGAEIAGGDFNDDGLSDMAICSVGLTGTAGAFGGAMYLYYGKDNIGIDETMVSADTDLPGLIPDVALLGSGGEWLCNRVKLGDVDGRGGADLMIAQFSFAPTPRVFGFYGGSANRFCATPCTGGPVPVKLTLDLTSNTIGGSGWDAGTPAMFPGFPQRPDFSLQKPTNGSTAFPSTIALVDLDGNGTTEVAVSDRGALHGPAGEGEIYVYRGNIALTGAIAAPDATPTPPSQLMYLLRYNTTATGFGVYMDRIATPRCLNTPCGATEDSADWLYVQAGTNRGIVFRGSNDALNGAIPGIVPRDTTINTSAFPVIYPIGGATKYWLLDNSDWGGNTPTYYGGALANIGHFDGMVGTDILVAPRDDNYNHVFMYSYSATDDTAGNLGFVKRAIIQGSASTCSSTFVAKCGFGYSVSGIGNFQGAPNGSAPQFAITTWSSFATGGMVHVYR